MRNEVACEEQSEKPFACGLVRLSTTQNSLMLAVVHHLKQVQSGLQFVAKNVKGLLDPKCAEEMIHSKTLIVILSNE